MGPRASRHELRFRSLHDPNRSLGFPCDSEGRVDVRKLSTRACSNYVRAYTSLGREYALPIVALAQTHPRTEAPSPEKAPRPIPGRQPDERKFPPEQPPPMTPTEPPIPPAIEDPKPEPITDDPDEASRPGLEGRA
jgi:hypothetical protein